MSNGIQFKIIYLKSKTNREEKFDATEELRDLTKNNDTTTSGNDKKELGKSLAQAQNLSKSIMQDMKRDLELTQNFFLRNSIDYEQKIIPENTIKKCSNNNYSPAKVKSRSFLKNISYNRLKYVDFVNVLFIIDCYTYIPFNLNPFFLERKFDDKSDREYVETLWNCQFPNEFHIYIYRNDNFLTLNKLSLKYQNGDDIANNFILEDNSNFLLLK